MMRDSRCGYPQGTESGARGVSANDRVSRAGPSDPTRNGRGNASACECEFAPSPRLVEYRGERCVKAPAWRCPVRPARGRRPECTQAHRCSARQRSAGESGAAPRPPDASPALGDRSPHPQGPEETIAHERGKTMRIPESAAWDVERCLRAGLDACSSDHRAAHQNRNGSPIGRDEAQSRARKRPVDTTNAIAAIAALALLAVGVSGKALAQSQTVVENFGQSGNLGLEVGDVAQTFETGPNTGGYTVTHIRLEANARPNPVGTSSTVRAMLCNVDSSGKPPHNLGFCTWTETKRFFDPGDLDFELERAVRLLPNTKYAIVADRTAGANPPLSATGSGSADAASSAGWDIGAGGHAWQWKMTKRKNGTFHERWERVPWARYLRFGLYGRFNLLNEPNRGNPPVFRDDDDLVELTIRENQDAGANVGRRLSDIVDRRGQTVTYRIVPDIAGNEIGGPDGDLFDIDPNNGQITAKQPFDFESAKAYYQFGVSASNAIGASDGVNVRVRVTDVNEPPAALTLCDGISPGGRGILCGTDPDPGEFWVRARSDTEIKVNWARPNAARGRPRPRFYLVAHRTGTSGPFDSHRVGASSALDYAHTIEGLRPDTEYQVRLIVNNGEGNASSQIVTVRTHAHPQYAFRLADTSGTNPQVGRPEFFFRGKWGTVTDHRADNAGNRSGALMCRLAGFGDGESIADPSAQLGSRYRAAAPSMPIWLDGVRCEATDTNIHQCSHAGWGESNGEHSEDLWVRCWNGTPATAGPAPVRAWIENGTASWLYIQFDTTLAGGAENTPAPHAIVVNARTTGSSDPFERVLVNHVEVFPNTGRVRLALEREIAWSETVKLNSDAGAVEDRFGAEAPRQVDYAVDNEVGDDVPPKLTAGETSGDGRRVTVWFTEPLDRETRPDPGRFTVRFTTREVVADENGMGTVVDTDHDATPSAVEFAAAADLTADARSRIAAQSECSAAPHACALVLTMSDRDRIRGQDVRTYTGGGQYPIRSGHNVVKVRYADPDTANDATGVVQDPFGNDAHTSHFASVKNSTTYGRGLLPLSAFVEPRSVWESSVVFEWPFSDEDFPSESELRSAFSMTASGTPRLIDHVFRDRGADNRINIQHDDVKPGEAVTISYTKPSGDGELKDRRGIEVASFTDFPVANPAFSLLLQSAVLTGSGSMELRFTLDMDPRAVPPMDSFTIKGEMGDQDVHEVTGIEFDPDNARIVRLSSDARPFTESPSLTIEYTRPAKGGLRSTGGAELATVTAGVLDTNRPKLTVDSVEVTEGIDATADFTVRLTPAATETVTVDYTTVDALHHSATEGEDYTPVNGTLTFTPGETEKTVSVPIIDDSVEDDGEFFELSLGEPVGGNAFVGLRRFGQAHIRNDESLTPAVTPLTAGFSGAPAGHGGQTFTGELAFSEELPLSYRTLQGGDGQAGVIAVTGGAVTRAARVTAGENRRWTITVEPDGSDDVTLTLPATTDCEAADAICTEDDRPLSAAVTASVPYEAVPDTQVVDTPFTVRLAGVPAEHDGSSAVSFEVHFSDEPHEYSYRTLRDETLDIRQGGTRLAPTVKRKNTPSNRAWTVTVEPASKADLTVAIAATADCAAPGAVCNEDGEPLSNAVSATVPGPPGLSVADATVTEAAGATMDFAVTMSRASASTVTVDYATSDGTATAGSDYTSTSGTLDFAAGETSKTVSVPVLDDAIDDGGETFTLTLSNPSGGNAYLADATATGTIENSDPMPQAWLVRFGRTVASQAVDAIGGRMEGGGGSHVTVAGQSLSLFGQEMTPEQRNEMEEALRTLTDAQGPTHTMSGRDVLLGTRFQLSAGADGEGGVGFTAWGEVATGGFEADVDATRLDGNVTTGFLGADVRADRWLAGLALSVSKGDGDYALVDGADRDDVENEMTAAHGDVESEMTTLYPYVQVGMTDTVDVWGLAGWGNGELTLTQPSADPAEAKRYTTDIAMRMGAVGVRGEVVSPDEAEGLRIAVKSDAFWVTTESDAVTSAHGRLGAAEGDASRVRLLVEGSRRFETGGGALTPTLEVGLRHDGGDAETGAGLEAGAALRYEGARFSIEGSVRTLVAHEESGYEEWGASGAVRVDPGAWGRGLSLTVAPSWGTGTGTGGLWSARDAAALTPEYEVDGERRVDAEVGYGFGLASTPGTVTPFAALSLADEYRTMRAGTRWALGYDASLELEGSRASGIAGEHDTTVMLRASVRF